MRAVFRGQSGPFLSGGILFRAAREDPTKIGKAIEITQDLWICILDRSRATLSPAADRAREIKSGGGRVFTRDHPVFWIKRLVLFNIHYNATETVYHRGRC